MEIENNAPEFIYYRTIVRHANQIFCTTMQGGRTQDYNWKNTGLQPKQLFETLKIIESNI